VHPRMFGREGQGIGWMHVTQLWVSQAPLEKETTDFS
jgi:hypothetical protein